MIASDASSTFLSNLKQALVNLGSLALWSLPLLLRAGEPLKCSAIGLVPALACGVGMALLLWGYRAYTAAHPQNETQNQVVLKQCATLTGYLWVVLPAHQAWTRSITLFSVLVGVCVGSLDTGRHGIAPPLAPERRRPEESVWRLARDQAITASELALRVTYALRLTGAFF